MRSSLSGLTGIDVPRPEQGWARRLTESFEGLDPSIQRNITEIIRHIRETDPGKAVEIAHRIGDFFNYTGDCAGESGLTLNQFLQKIQTDLEQERKKKIN